MRKWTPAFVALAYVLTACSAGSGVHTPDAGTDANASSSPPSVNPTTEESSPSTPSPRSDGKQIVTIQGGVPGPIALDSGTVAYPFADDSESWNTVRTSRDGTERTVATSEWDEGLVNWVALSGDGWLAYVDQDHTQGDADPNVLWRVWAVDLSSDERVLLASNGETSDPYVPVVKGGGGYIFWSRAEKDRTARELAWKPGWDEPRTLLTYAELTPGSETYSDGAIVYLGPNGKGIRGHTTGGDCWRVPLDGGQPEALTHTALAMGCAASDDTLIWTQHLPADDPRNPQVTEQPFTTWTLDLTAPDGHPEKLYEGIQSGAAPAAGDGFVAWEDVARRIILRSSTTGTQVKLPRSISMAASGRRLAVTQQAGRNWTVMLYDAP